VLSRNSHTAATSQGLLVFAVLSTRALDKLMSLELQALPLVFLRRLLGVSHFSVLGPLTYTFPVLEAWRLSTAQRRQVDLPDQNFRENGVLDRPLSARQIGIPERQPPRGHKSEMCAPDTYDHRSVKTGHPVRKHRLSNHVFQVNEDSGREGIVIPGSWNLISAHR
jgi:hypothetical protein